MHLAHKCPIAPLHGAGDMKMAKVKNAFHDDLERRRAVDDDMDIDVCQNCGAYFAWERGQKNQRCSPCRAGLNDPPRSG